MNQVLYNFKGDVSMEKPVFIVNGKARAGKDTFAEILNNYVCVHKYSSVTKVKIIAASCGWDGKKEERDRKFLHDLKMLTTRYSDLSFNDVIREIEDYRSGDIAADVMLVDVREPEDIKRLVEATGAFTVFIQNDNVPNITSNEADANVENYNYDFVILNNGTLDDFNSNICLFMEYFQVQPIYIWM